MEGSGKRRRFDAAFKAEAVRLVTHGGLTQSQGSAAVRRGRQAHCPVEKADAAARHTERAFPGQATTMTPNWLDFGVKWRLCVWSATF